MHQIKQWLARNHNAALLAYIIFLVLIFIVIFF